MTAAYTVFANNGLYHKPTAITRIRSRDGRVKPLAKQNVNRVISRSAAHKVHGLLQEVIARGTGKQAKGIRGAAGKTGTTDNNNDVLFVGYTERIAAGVWFGYDKGDNLGSGESGGRTAAPVWREFMQKALKR